MACRKTPKPVASAAEEAELASQPPGIKSYLMDLFKSEDKMMRGALLQDDFWTLLSTSALGLSQDENDALSKHVHTRLTDDGEDEVEWNEFVIGVEGRRLLQQAYQVTLLDGSLHMTQEQQLASLDAVSKSGDDWCELPQSLTEGARTWGRR